MACQGNTVLPPLILCDEQFAIGNLEWSPRGEGELHVPLIRENFTFSPLFAIKISHCSQTLLVKVPVN